MYLRWPGNFCASFYLQHHPPHPVIQRPAPYLFETIFGKFKDPFAGRGPAVHGLDKPSEELMGFDRYAAQTS